MQLNKHYSSISLHQWCGAISCCQGQNYSPTNSWLLKPPDLFSFTEKPPPSCSSHFVFTCLSLFDALHLLQPYSSHSPFLRFSCFSASNAKEKPTLMTDCGEGSFKVTFLLRIAAVHVHYPLLENKGWYRVLCPDVYPPYFRVFHLHYWLRHQTASFLTVKWHHMP